MNFENMKRSDFVIISPQMTSLVSPSVSQYEFKRRFCKRNVKAMVIRLLQYLPLIFLLALLNLLLTRLILLGDQRIATERSGNHRQNLFLPDDSKTVQRVARSVSSSNQEMLPNNLTVMKFSPVATDDNSRGTTTDDIFIAVKTTQPYHNSRLRLLLDTWVALAKSQTYFFTDAIDEQMIEETGGHLVNTNCPRGHNRRSLCCKMAVEFDSFLRSGKRWFCHVDDDNYLNVPRLLEVLKQFNHSMPYYLGRPSLDHPLDYRERFTKKAIQFWFATGGAGFCVSRSLSRLMEPLAGKGKLLSLCEQIRLPDDVTLGYIIEHELNQKLTVVSDFHSHLEGLWSYSLRHIQQMISFGYNSQAGIMNTVDVAGFSKSIDPTRFLSVHCHLFPHLKQCATMKFRLAFLPLTTEQNKPF